MVAAFALGCGGGSSTPDANVADVPGDAVAREVIMEDVPLAVNDITEAILVGGPGDYARVQMTADAAPLDWNLHGHANGGTQVITEEFGVTSVNYLFTPSAMADWYVLIRNKGQTGITVKLTISLYEGMTWSGFQ